MSSVYFINVFDPFLMSKFTTALEAVSKENEKEVVIYARIGNYEGLKQAAQVLGQEQAQIIGPGGRVRVRKNTDHATGTEAYEMTAKRVVSREGLQSMKEETTAVNADVFNVFLRGCDQKFVKTRYVFPIEKTTVKSKDLSAEVVLEGLKFEVDVFTTPSGKTSTWCKIDVEVQSLLPQLAEKGLTLADIELNVKVSGLPFEPQAFFVDTGEKTGPMRELVTAIYAAEFITPVQ